MIAAIERNTGEAAAVALAGAGYCNEAALAAPAESAPRTELIVALGREGKRLADVNAAQLSHTAAMAGKLESPAERSRYHRRRAIVEPANGWIRHDLGFLLASSACVAPRRCAVSSRSCARR